MIPKLLRHPLCRDIINIFTGALSEIPDTGGTNLLVSLQMTTEVNVEYKHLLRSQMRGPEMRSFDLDIDKVLFYGRNGSLILYNICMR